MGSVQVTPVDRRGLPRAWIRGCMVFDRLQAGQPDGVASLRFSAVAGPTAWRLIGALFPEFEVELPTGSW